MKLLHLDTSPLGTYSVSRGLTAAIVAEFARNEPQLQVVYRDAASQPIPHWTLPVGEADPSALLGNEIIEEFLAADVVVIGSPMYNFSISSQLKAWIDRIAVAGKTFRYTAEGPEGLAGNKRVIVASSRGGVYSDKSSPAAGLDFQEPYLRAVFGFLGVTEVEFVRAEGVAISAEHKETSVSGALESIVQLRKAA
jgi:FMN-dependent NADH-azoreductase